MKVHHAAVPLLALLLTVVLVGGCDTTSDSVAETGSAADTAVVADDTGEDGGLDSLQDLDTHDAAGDTGVDMVDTAVDTGADIDAPVDAVDTLVEDTALGDVATDTAVQDTPVQDTLVDTQPDTDVGSEDTQADTSGATTTQIGPEGGTATSADGKLTVDVPPGALAFDVDVTIVAANASTYPQSELIVGAYELGPDDITFDVDVTMTYQGTQYLPLGTSIGFIDADRWNRLATETMSNVAVAAHTNHFSPYAVLKPSLQDLDNRLFVTPKFDSQPAGDGILGFVLAREGKRAAVVHSGCGVLDCIGDMGWQAATIVPLELEAGIMGQPIKLEGDQGLVYFPAIDTAMIAYVAREVTAPMTADKIWEVTPAGTSLLADNYVDLPLQVRSRPAIAGESLYFYGMDQVEPSEPPFEYGRLSLMSVTEADLGSPQKLYDFRDTNLAYLGSDPPFEPRVALSPDGTAAALAVPAGGFESWSVGLYDLVAKTWTELDTNLDTGHSITQLAFSYDGTRLGWASAPMDGPVDDAFVKVIELGSGSMEVYDGAVRFAFASDSGDKLYIMKRLSPDKHTIVSAGPGAPADPVLLDYGVYTYDALSPFEQIGFERPRIDATRLLFLSNEAAPQKLMQLTDLMPPTSGLPIIAAAELPQTIHQSQPVFVRVYVADLDVTAVVLGVPGFAADTVTHPSKRFFAPLQKTPLTAIWEGTFDLSFLPPGSHWLRIVVFESPSRASMVDVLRTVEP